MFLFQEMLALWLSKQYLGHAMGTAVAFGQFVQFDVFDLDFIMLHFLLEVFRHPICDHDVPWGDAQIVAAKMLLVFIADRNNLDVSVLQEFDKATVGGGLFVFQSARRTGVDVNGNMVRLSCLCVHASGGQGDEIAVDDVEIGVKVHL